jgi:uncharacterized protein
MALAALSLDEIDRLGELLAKIPEPFIPMEADMLDGYLTALALMKNPPEQQDWMPLIFDMEGRERAHLKEPEQSELRKLILRRGGQLEAAILNEKPIDPIIYEAEDDEGNPIDGPESIEALSSFSNGFSAACSMWPELLKNQSKAVQAAVVGILRYETKDEEDADEETHSILSDIDESVAFLNLDEAVADLEACVQEIAEVTRAEDIAAQQKQQRPRSNKRR